MCITPSPIHALLRGNIKAILPPSARFLGLANFREFGISDSFCQEPQVATGEQAG